MDATKRNFKDQVFFFFFPISYTRMYAQSISALLLIVVLFVWSDNQLRSQLLSKPISGRVTDIKIGSKGGSAGGKYSGRSTYYHFQITGYRRNFQLENASVFENWQFGADDFKKGDQATFRIMAADEPNLQKPTEYRTQQNIAWPQEGSTMKIYGLAINGKTVLTANSTIRGQTYNRWFWLMVPLFIYSLFNILIRTRFKNWTQAAEDREFDQMVLGTDKRDIYQKAASMIGLIEQELKQLSDWRETPPDPQLFENMGAFGGNTMPFTTWLQFVFIPNVRAIIAEKGAFPKSSSVATYAYRNLDEDRYSKLNARLSVFDALFNS